MATKLKKRAFEQAKNLISNGKYVKNEKDKWSEHQPSADDENNFIGSSMIPRRIAVVSACGLCITFSNPLLIEKVRLQLVQKKR